MNYEVKREGKNQAELTITVEKETVLKSMNQAYLKLVKEVTIPGFRKGKAPRFVLEQKIGKAPIIEEAAEIMMSPAYAEAITTEGLEPVDRPEVEIVSIGEEEDFIFKATVTLRPEPELGEYKGLELKKREVTLTDEDVENEINRILDRHAKMVVVDDGVQDEDMVQISYKGYVDGEAFEGGSAEKYSLGIGSNTFIPGFEDQLKGHKAGEDVEVNVTFPEDYHAENLQGKDAKFDVHISEVRRKELPELTDDFVKMVSSAENIADFRETTKQRLEDSTARQIDDDLRNQAVDALLDITDVEIPEIMINDKIDSFMEDMNSRLSQQGLSLERYVEFTGKTMKDLREESRPNAERAVKTEVALMEVAKRENLEATEVDIDAECTKVAMMTNTELDVIKDRLMKTGQYSVLVFTILVKKAIDFLVDNAKIVPYKEDAEQAE
ncbi:MAG TPA: trigger factor, partial [Firmicutes bacterium]|nr:trigger factor [Bacillota bacterium]